MSFSTLFKQLTTLPVPKTRRPKFDLQLCIHDLSNIPLVTGQTYVKWHLVSSGQAEHRGRTGKALVGRDHKSTWDYAKLVPVRLVVDRGGMLQESEIQFEIVQEYSPTGKERICLGNVRLNLAEYVTSGAAAGAAAGGGEEEIQGTLGGHTTGAPAGGAAAGATVGSNAHAAAGVDAAAATEPLGVVRRYLLQDSKINSTLKIGIHMSQTEGDRSFRAPQLRTAPVFGGIAGILSSEAGAGDGDDGSNMPSMSSKAQESGKLQDLYRRNLCASWAAQHGELAADKCIEDLFAGGDGWARLGDAAAPTSQASAGSTARVGTANQGSTEEDSENERRGSTNSIIRGHHKRHSSGSTLKGPGRNTVTSSSGPGAVPGRASLEHQVQESHEGKRHGTIGRNEVDEFSLREDLRSWEISAKG